MECGLGGQPTALRIFIPDTGTHPPGMTLARKAWVRLNRLRTGVGHFRSCLYKWGTASFAACEWAQKNKQPTVWSFNVQSIDLPIDCMTWRFWTMRQSNCCSAPSPRSSAAKQWFEQLAQAKEEEGRNACLKAFAMDVHFLKVCSQNVCFNSARINDNSQCSSILRV